MEKNNSTAGAPAQPACRSCATFPRWLFIAFAVLVCVKLWLASGLTVNALTIAGHDDALFVKLAAKLAGQPFKWLGAYTNLTLAKGPFFPIWIAIMFILGIPLLLSEQLLYAASCAVLIFSLRGVLKKPVHMLLAFAVVLFNPMSYMDFAATRIIRDAIYHSLTLLVFACALEVFLQYGKPLRKAIPWAIALGVSMAAFWLTREEGIWILPSLLLIAAVGVVFRYRHERGRLSDSLIVYGLPVFICVSLLGVVAGLNKAYYGDFITVETKSPEFLGAYGALTRIRHQEWHPYIPVPEEVRHKAYKASPAFAELQGYLDGPPGEGWKGHGSDIDNVIDFHGGWFMWALRDGVEFAGHHKSAGEAAEYYGQLAREINDACARGGLECGPKRASLMPPWNSAYNMPFLMNLKKAFIYTVTLQSFAVRSNPSVGSQKQLALFEDMTRDRIAPPVPLSFRGWAFHASKPISLSIRDSGGAVTKIDPVVSPDVYSYFALKGMDYPNASQARFSVESSCSSGCFLDIATEGRPVQSFPLNGSVTGRIINGPDIYGELDDVNADYRVPLKYQARLDNIKLKALSLIAKPYQTATPILLVAGLVVFSLRMVFMVRKRKLDTVCVILTALAGGIFIRLLIVSLIETTSFHAIDFLYMAPAYPFLFLFIALSLTGKDD